MARRAFLLISLIAFTACAHFPENEPLNEALPDHMGYRFENLKPGPGNTDGLLVCLSFSGGGARAGAMAYGAIQALSETKIEGGTKSLLDEVDFVSAASGGAFAAAYYGTFGERAFLEEFRERVLIRDLGMELFWKAALCPYHLVRLCSPWFNRSDLATEHYANTIFGRRAYSDLRNRGRPYVILNASDLLAGERFEFTQDSFDRLGSTLARVPIARAVAASAAFPVLLTPVAFRNYYSDDRYVHLVDGGVVDNLGLGYVLDAYERGAIYDLIRTGAVKRVVFVVVNARNRPREDMSASPQAPGAMDVLSMGLGAAIDQRGEDQSRRLADLSRRGIPGSPEIKVDCIEIDLADLKNRTRRNRMLAIETTFGLEEEVVDELIETSAELLLTNPTFKRLLADLNQEAAPR